MPPGTSPRDWAAGRVNHFRQLAGGERKITENQ
jgi:hypothetical protein